jgi:hypothetical protein
MGLKLGHFQALQSRRQREREACYWL